MELINIKHINKNVLQNFTNETNLLHALADSKRQQIITFLFVEGKSGLTVANLTRKMEITQPAVSHHLRVLREANLVSYRRNGLQKAYYLTMNDSLAELESFIHELRLQVNIKCS